MISYSEVRKICKEDTAAIQAIMYGVNNKVILEPVDVVRVLNLAECIQKAFSHKVDLAVYFEALHYVVCGGVSSCIKATIDLMVKQYTTSNIIDVQLRHAIYRMRKIIIAHNELFDTEWNSYDDLLRLG